MSKGVKIGLIIGALVLAIAAIWYFFLGGSGPKVIAGGDINGSQYDIQLAPSGTVAADTAKAKSLGAKAFMQRGGTTWFKNATGPVTYGNTGGTLYIL